MIDSKKVEILTDARIRDDFAAAALQGMIAGSSWSGTPIGSIINNAQETRTRLAVAAFAMADEMMKMRKEYIQRDLQRAKLEEERHKE